MVVAMQPAHPEFNERIKNDESTTFTATPLEFSSLELCKQATDLIVKREYPKLKQNFMQFVYVKCQEMLIPHEGV